MGDLVHHRLSLGQPACNHQRCHIALHCGDSGDPDLTFNPFACRSHLLTHPFRVGAEGQIRQARDHNGRAQPQHQPAYPAPPFGRAIPDFEMVQTRLEVELMPQRAKLLLQRIKLDQALNLFQAGPPIAFLEVLHGKPVKRVLEVGLG